MSSGTAADFLPARQTLASLRKAAAHCRACDLYKQATQTVFGEGNPHAPAMFVGEQPGDKEDREGHPFVGPAGKLLRDAMSAAGIAADDVYLPCTRPRSCAPATTILGAWRWPHSSTTCGSSPT